MSSSAAAAASAIAGRSSPQAEATEAELATYSDKLAQLEAEAQSIVQEYIQQGETAKARILKEAEATAAGDAGRWEVTFPAREASTTPISVTVNTGNEKVDTTACSASSRA